MLLLSFRVTPVVKPRNCRQSSNAASTTSHLSSWLTLASMSMMPEKVVSRRLMVDGRMRKEEDGEENRRTRKFSTNERQREDSIVICKKKFAFGHSFNKG